MEHESFVPGMTTVRLVQALRTPDVVRASLPGWQPDAAAGGDGADSGTAAGRLRLRVGGTTITYRGTVTVADEGPGFTVTATGTEVRGEGGVTVTAQLSLVTAVQPEPGVTLVWRAEADATGRIAALEPTAVEAAVRRLLDRFCTELGAHAPSGEVRDRSGGTGGSAAAAETASTGAAAVASEPADENADRHAARPDATDAAERPAAEDAPSTSDADAPGEAGTSDAAECPAAEDAPREAGAPDADAPDEAGAPDAGARAADGTTSEAGTPGEGEDPAAETMASGADEAEAGKGTAAEGGGRDDAEAPDADTDVPDESGEPGVGPRDDDEPEADVVDDLGEPVPPAELDDFDLVEVEVEVPESAAALDDLVPPAEAAHARRTMIGRSAEEVDHAPPRGRYAPVPAPESGSAAATLRWAAPVAAALVASAVVVGRVLRRRG